MSDNYCSKCHSALMSSGHHLQVTQCVIDQHDTLTQQNEALRAALTEIVGEARDSDVPENYRLRAAHNIANKALESEK